MTFIAANQKTFLLKKKLCSKEGNFSDTAGSLWQYNSITNVSRLAYFKILILWKVKYIFAKYDNSLLRLLKIIQNGQNLTVKICFEKDEKIVQEIPQLEKNTSSHKIYSIPKVHQDVSDQLRLIYVHVCKWYACWVEEWKFASLMWATFNRDDSNL